ncbi:Mur ligase [Coniella lustricola]|uniref:tetrahydrofolate synthase n=1 Tax=Coniella lustricola TaxID=2025994 RepID=A0A2T3A7N0_9PEZI|nr:Mur ligase [Coniella lustricola]
MRQWLHRLGHTEEDIDNLNIIHVAGTKGKGSTCAYIESFLRYHGKGINFPRKTGLYTSPHLISVNERIRINFEPLSYAQFSQYVFEVRDGLALDNDLQGPGFLQLLAIISFHAFLREKVDVAIYETHHGGEYCATNIIRRPVVTAVTIIDKDHLVDLGPSIENVAWHKAGIFKEGSRAFTVPQQPKVLSILQGRATDKQLALEVVDIDSRLPIAFSSSVQRSNCSLAKAVANAFLSIKSPGGRPRQLSESDILEGIKHFYWPGRFEIIHHDSFTWFLDGAHNEISVEVAAKWFQNQSTSDKSGDVTRILIFTQFSDKRDTQAVLSCLARSLSMQIHLVIFTTNRPGYGDVESCLNQSNMPEQEFSEVESELLDKYSRTWENIKSHSGGCIYRASTVKDAVHLAEKKGNLQGQTHVLVTGSLYLVGAVLGLRVQNLARTANSTTSSTVPDRH